MAWLALLAVAAAVRLPTLTAGLPYMNYVDEGHVLHRVNHLLTARTWEPDTYVGYPSLSFYLITAAATAWSPVYAAVNGHPLAEDLLPSPTPDYEIVEPRDLIVLGRLITLAFSLGIVILTGLLARRLAGHAAGLAAAWLAALVPALVARSAIVTVDPIATFFILSSLWFAEGVREGHRPRRAAALAGAMAGFAMATKYPAVLVCLPLTLAVLLSQAAPGEKLRRLFLAGASTVAAFCLGMPGAVLRTRKALDGLLTVSHLYQNAAPTSFWQQAARRAEWDLPLEHPEVGILFLILATAGLAAGLRDRRWSRSVWGWLLFALALGLLMTSYPFRAFRNLLSLVPLGCILIALLYATVRERISRPLTLDLAAAALPILLFTPALHQYIGHQVRLEDSREEALEWLAAHTSPGRKVLISEELAFLPSRIAALPARPTVQPWGRAREGVLNRRFHFLILGEMTHSNGKPRIGPRMRKRILRRYELVTIFGSDPCLLWSFKGNRQTVYVLKRRPRPSQPTVGPPPQPLSPRVAADRSSPPSPSPEPSGGPPGSPP